MDTSALYYEDILQKNADGFKAVIWGIMRKGS